ELHVGEDDRLWIGRALEGQVERVADRRVSAVAADDPGGRRLLDATVRVGELDLDALALVLERAELGRPLDPAAVLLEVLAEELLGVGLRHGEDEREWRVELVEGEVDDAFALGVDRAAVDL